MEKSVYQEIASRVDATHRCLKQGNFEWQMKHEDAIENLMKNAPSGSGVDSGTEIDMDKSTGERLVFTFGFHHMNDAGMYDGWTEHTLIVKASLLHGITLKITGPDRNEVKDYLYEVYHEWLTAKIPA